MEMCLWLRKKKILEKWYRGTENEYLRKGLLRIQKEKYENVLKKFAKTY